MRAIANRIKQLEKRTSPPKKLVAKADRVRCIVKDGIYVITEEDVAKQKAEIEQEWLKKYGTTEGGEIIVYCWNTSRTLEDETT